MKTNATSFYAKLDSRGRVWVPKKLREQMGMPNSSALKVYLDQRGNAVLEAVKETEE